MIQHRHLNTCLAVLVALCGCGTSESVAPPATTASVTKVDEKVTPTPAVATVEPSPAPGKNSELPTTEPTADAEKLAAEYQPPFPDRVHLFLAPKREGKSTAGSDQDEAVELLGFVNVNDNHKAVLSINGMVYPVSEGDSQFGVEVISIQPPGVVLQRGRQRWQASLEN